MSQEDRNSNAAARIIKTFRASSPTPSEQEWMALIEAHPEFAGEIADAALVERTAEHLDESDLEAPLDHGVFEAGVSRAINRLYEIPSAALSKAQEKIGAAQGTAVRTLAREVGLGAASSLLSGVLVGTIEAPRKLVGFLATKWESPSWVLLECFRRTHDAAAVPAFKAEFGKPGIATEPKSWAEAVRSLNLPELETQRLLRLQD
jgi:hypothetical protein